MKFLSCLIVALAVVALFGGAEAHKKYFGGGGYGGGGQGYAPNQECRCECAERVPVHPVPEYIGSAGYAQRPVHYGGGGSVVSGGYGGGGAQVNGRY